MSSLQKFHRRTNVIPSILSPFTTIGSGNDTVGYYMGGISTNKIIVAPASTDVQLIWGSAGTARNTLNTTDGIPNTNTLYSFGSTAHPAAYYCKTTTQGGYNTWYLGAINELMAINSNKSATPFATANSYTHDFQWSSTEHSANNGKYYAMISNRGDYAGKGDVNKYVRPIRRSTI